MTPKRFLIVSPQGLGDSLEATPLVHALREADSDAVIDVAVMRSSSKQLFESLGETINEVIYLPLWERGYGAFIRELIFKRRRHRYDVAFLTYPAARREYQAVTWMFPARRRIAHRYESPSLTNLLWLNTELVPVRAQPNALRNLDLMADAGFALPHDPQYMLPQHWIVGERPNDRRIAIHAGSIDHGGFALKRWPPERFQELGAHLAEQGYEIVFIAGPDEVAISRRLAHAVQGSSIFEGTIPQLARFLASCRLLVSNDTGVAHLCAAVGRPVIALFGPTPVECAPFGKHVLALRPSPCPPCFSPTKGITGCVLGIDFACLKRDLPVESVERAVFNVLRTPVVQTL